ncbi:MAG TPA: hypothetical protein PLP33_07330 [Leptospiraceae bacterium]|nr:hypothetical protein [Leptospiraceae bacterium]
MDIVVKKRGRPPGSKNKKKGGEEKPVPAATNSELIPKKRGRPPKNPQPVAAPKPELIQENPKPVSVPTTSTEVSPKTEATSNFRQFEVRDRVKKTTNGQIGYVKIHKPGSRYVYIDWGGDYMDFVAVDLLELVNPVPSKRTKKEA